MSLGLPIGPALEQLREVVSILRELGNAGPRDQSFKQWRQVSVTLLQRIWPNDQAKAARFRRIPFSPPSSRADTRTIRECYERGVCEAIAYLDSLIAELEQDGRVGRPLVRPPEAPLADAEIAPDTYGAEPPFAPEPAPLDPETRETYVLPPARPPAAAPPPPAAAAPPPAHLDHSGRDSFLVSSGHPEAAAPPPAAQAPRPARDKAPKLGLGRTKQRLKDMLGFGDETPEPTPRPAASLPTPPAPAPPRPVAPPQPVAPRPVAAAPPPPPPPPPVAVAPPLPPPAASPTSPAQRLAFKRFEPPPPPAIEEPRELEEEPVDGSAEWSAPVHPLPGSKVVVGRPVPAPVPPPAADAYPQEDPEEGVDFDFDPEGGMEVDSEPPPATLREMLDRVPLQRAAVPPPAVRELLSLARAVDQLGVPHERRALVRAALSDLGQQMEAPPVEWSAIRQTMAFVLDYPLIARRVIPLLLPYLDEAA